MAEKILDVKDLVISFKTDNGLVKAVRGVSFDLEAGETLCIVGESGSGKSVTSKAIMGILANNAVVEGGSIMYRGDNLLEVSEEEFHKIRGNKIGMIFQDPLSSLNPIVKIGKQITEATLLNGNKIKKMYEEIISNDFTNYKNAITKNRINCDKAKHQLEKRLEEIKDSPQFKELKKQYISEYNEEIKKNKESLKTKLPTLKANLKSKKKEAKSKVKEYKANVKAQYDEEIKLPKAKMKEEKLQWFNFIPQLSNLYLKRALNTFFNFTSSLLKQENKPHHQNYLKRYDEYIAKKNEELKRRNEVLAEINEVKTNYINKLKITKKEAKNRALEIMREVGIPLPEKRFKQYPFEFSGGMRQRIVIAIALTAAPEILICDEPTTALDVTIQAQILELIKKIQKERNIACVFITHDLGVVANMADRVAVMYAGKIVEYGKVDEIFFEPKHPYTWALLSSIPDVDSKERLDAIPGTPPNMIYPPKGDAFALRSKYAMAIDFEHQPPYFKVTDTHYAATWLLHPSAPKVEMPKIVSERIRLAIENRDKEVSVNE